MSIRQVGRISAPPSRPACSGSNLTVESATEFSNDLRRAISDACSPASPSPRAVNRRRLEAIVQPQRPSEACLAGPRACFFRRPASARSRFMRRRAIQDHREKVASSRGLEPARHDNLIGWHIDCDLAVVAFYEAIAGRQDTAVRLVKFFCAQSGEPQSAPRNTRSASPSRRGARRGSL